MKRTMYQAARHTPKRGVGGSNPLVDASKQCCKPVSGLQLFFLFHLYIVIRETGFSEYINRMAGNAQ